MELKYYEEAGRILDRVLSEARKTVKEGIPLLEIAERLERKILKEGGKPAFPCNLSTNQEAAHYTPGPGDERVAEGVLKVDCGVHVEGYIADAAFTVDLTGEHGKLAEAAEEALQAALSVMRAGVDVREVGKAVEDVAKKYGFRPVENLGGHSLERYRLHAGLFIPNVPRGGGILEEGMVVAVEPFISMGRGFVKEVPPVEIFSLTGKKSRSPRAERVRGFIEKEYGPLPFARRWVAKKIPAATQWLKFMIIDGSVHPYPVLADTDLVAQAEASVIVEKDGVKVFAGKRWT